MEIERLYINSKSPKEP